MTLTPSTSGLPFDPDKCALSKDQVIEVGDELVRRWKESPRANRTLIAVARGLQWLLRRAPQEDVEQYYREAFKMVYYIMQKNAHASDPTLSRLPAPEPPKPVFVRTKTPTADFLKYIRKGGMACADE